MALEPITNIIDTYLNEGRPDKNYGAVPKLWVLGGTSTENKVAYMHWPLSIRSQKINQSFLDLYQGPAVTGSITVTVKPLTQKFGVNKVTWATKKTVTATNQATMTKTSPAAGTLWHINIKPMMQAVADAGLVWYGVEISIDVNTAGIWFHSSQTTTPDLKPVVWLDNSNNPSQPDQLSPSSDHVIGSNKPTLRSRFRDPNADAVLAAGHWQVAPTVAELGTGTGWDSGWVTTTSPSIDLLNPPAGVPAFTAIANNASFAWRVEYRDSNGFETGFSVAATAKYLSKGTVSWFTPTGTPGTVLSLTPQIAWTYTVSGDGLGHESRREILLSYTSEPTNYFWTSNQEVSTGTSYEIPPGVITDPSKQHRLTIRSWDLDTREDIPSTDRSGDSWREAFVDFNISASSATAPFTSVTATPLDTTSAFAGSFPVLNPGWISIKAQRASPPDDFLLLRDGVPVWEYDDYTGLNIFAGGTSFEIIDRDATPGVSHTWELRAVEDGVQSSVNTQVSRTPKNPTAYISDHYGFRFVYLFDAVITPQSTDMTQVFMTQDGRTVQVEHSSNWHGGSASGLISMADGLISSTHATMTQMEADFQYMWTHKNKPYRLSWLNRNIYVYIRNLQMNPVRVGAQDVYEYEVSFDWVRTDDTGVIVL